MLIGALQDQLPGTRATGAAAGLHVVVELPGGMDAAHTVATAAQHGILTHPLEHYRARPALAGPPALVMGYSRHTTHQIQDAIRRLASISRGEPIRPQT